MHASIWRFRGDPHELMRGLSLCREHGLPDPERVDDFRVHAAFVNGERRV